MSQKPDEDAQNFLMRALTIRQSILVNADDDMGYDPLLVQKMFLKAVESGLREESKNRPHLQNLAISDEELCEQMKIIVSAELERKQNLVSPKVDLQKYRWHSLKVQESKFNNQNPLNRRKLNQDNLWWHYRPL